jgi:hypothetical protein
MLLQSDTVGRCCKLTLRDAVTPSCDIVSHIIAERDCLAPCLAARPHGRIVHIGAVACRLARRYCPIAAIALAERGRLSLGVEAVIRSPPLVS